MSDVHLGLQAITSEPSNAPIITRFIRFFLAVAILPPAVYFLVFNLTPLTFPLSPSTNAGLAAVFALNALTAIFALIAVFERAPPQQPLPPQDEPVSDRPKDE